jgi:hypothetical protein
MLLPPHPMTCSWTTTTNNHHNTKMVTPIPVAVLPMVMNIDAAAFHTDNEWHPHDPATTTPQLLASLWSQIASSTSSMVKGETDTVIYPDMIQSLNDGKYLSVLMAHLDCCKDVCDNFGITCSVVPYRQNNKVTGFTVKSFRNPDRDDFIDQEKFDYDVCFFIEKSKNYQLFFCLFVVVCLLF